MGKSTSSLKYFVYDTTLPVISTCSGYSPAKNRPSTYIVPKFAKNKWRLVSQVFINTVVSSKLYS